MDWDGKVWRAEAETEIHLASAGRAVLVPAAENARSEIVDLHPGTECYVRGGGFLQRLTEPGTDATGLTVVAHDVGEMEAMDLQVAEFKTEKMDLNVASLQDQPASK